MANHLSFEDQAGIPDFFYAAGSAWQRGSNENLNGLLRQYLPKQWYFNHLTQRELDAIAR